MRILFTRFPLESTYGGAEVQTLSLMRGLAARGHAVGFLGSCKTLLPRAREDHFPAAELDLGPPPVTKWGSISFLWRAPLLRRKLEATLAQFSSLEVVFMLSLTEKLLATKYLHGRGVKVFWVEHDRVGRWLRRNPWLPRLRRLSGLATTIAVSELSAQMYHRLGWPDDNVIAIPNGIDLERFTVNYEPSSRKMIRLGCVARLSQEKGVDLLVQAVAGLPDVTLDIVGKGPDEGYIRTMADGIAEREKQDPPRIRLLPMHSDLGTFYASLDALVLPSRDHDPFGLVAAEAMALGVPTIVTDACGIAGYLKPGKDALVVPAGSVAALRDAIVKLQDPAKRAALSEQGKKTARKKFALDAMVDAYEKLLS